MKRTWIMPLLAAMFCVGEVVGQQQQQKSWTDSVQVKGDVRYRHETIDEQGLETRERHRIRARLAAEAKANDKVKVGIGMSTTEKGDPVSSNQTLTDEFSRKSLYLDLAWFDWTMVGEDMVRLVGGKMKNPLINVGNLIWDGDVNPEGLALCMARTMGDMELVGNGAYFWIKEFNPDSKNAAHGDAMLYVGQVAAKYKIVEEAKITLGASYYQFSNLGGGLAKDFNYLGEEKTFGNSTRKVVSQDGLVTNVYYLADFAPVEAFAKLSFWLDKVPVEIAGQYVINDEADNFDAGYLVGLSVGKAKNPNTWEFGYQMYELEKDCVPGFMTDSDRNGGGTDGKGHVFSAKYQVMKNLQLGATFFMNEKGIADPAKTKDYERLQLDVVASF